MKNRTIIVKVLAALLALSLLVSFAGCKSGGETADVQKLVEEIAVDYGTYGDEAKDRINTLLKELSAADANTGARWSEIMKIWTSADLGKPLNYGVLPDGLPDSDELCIVVLGFQLNPDGSMKDELIERLKVALASANKYPKAYIVCTGGGTAAENESASEAGETPFMSSEKSIPASCRLQTTHPVLFSRSRRSIAMDMFETTA